MYVRTEADLLGAVANVGPVSVAVEADQSSWQHYGGGVLTGECGEDLDHGVLVVGFGKDEQGTAYWKVKNSWSASWGMSGYILIQRGVNKCGIATDGWNVVPTVNAAAPPSPPGPVHPLPPTPAPVGRTHYGAPPCLPDEFEYDWDGGIPTQSFQLCAPECSRDEDCPAAEFGTAKPVCGASTHASNICALRCDIASSDGSNGGCPAGSKCVYLQAFH